MTDLADEVTTPLPPGTGASAPSADDRQSDVEVFVASAPTGSKTEDASIPHQLSSADSDNKNSLKSELTLDLDVSANYKLPQPSPNVATKDGRKESLDSSGGSSVLNTSGGGGNIVKKMRKELKDKIVSPVIPQPGAWGDPRNHRYRPQPQRLTPQINKGQVTPKFKENNTRFQYGNYNRYVRLYIYKIFVISFECIVIIIEYYLTVLSKF